MGGAAAAPPGSVAFAYSDGGVYQIGEDQARSWIVGGTFVGSGRLFRAASYVDHRGVGISSTRT